MNKPKLNITHVSATSIESGAGRAAFRLHQVLRPYVNSQFLTGSPSHGDPSILSLNENRLARFKSLLWPYLNSKLSKLYLNRQESLFSSHLLGYVDLTKQSVIQDADIVQLYWVTGGFLNFPQLSELNKPIVWRLSDMWPFTGGCHYAGDCIAYRDSCGHCPTLGSSSSSDLSRYNWRSKNKLWSSLNLTVVAPSRWMADCAKKSSLMGNFDVRHIATGVDLNIFKPLDKLLARELLKLPKDKQLILSGALSLSDTRKGGYLLKETIERLNDRDDYHLVLFGQAAGLDLDSSKCTQMGRIQDEMILSLIYNAADMMIVPSIEDNLPNTAIEATACGTPVIGFRRGGLPDIIDHYYNGLIADDLSAQALENSIRMLLDNKALLPTLSSQARTKAKHDFCILKNAKKYLNLYEELFNTHRIDS